MLFHVGLSIEMINFDSPNTYNLVVFDKNKMDDAWPTGPEGDNFGPFKPSWETLALYLGSPFQASLCLKISHLQVKEF